MKNKSKSKSEEQFSPRIRFNWGYHDAAQAVEKGWACAEHYWGFAKQFGELIQHPSDVLARHHDRSYAEGWVRGIEDSKAGTYINDSEPAWRRYVGEGVVHES